MKRKESPFKEKDIPAWMKVEAGMNPYRLCWAGYRGNRITDQAVCGKGRYTSYWHKENRKNVTCVICRAWLRQNGFKGEWEGDLFA